MSPASDIMSPNSISTSLKGSSGLPGTCGAGKGAGLAKLFQAHDTGTNENQGLFERASTSFVKNNNNDQSY